jgi:hypothetical protein
MTTIIDNLEVTITNVHARYEDTMTIPGVSFSAGVTLDSCTLKAANKNWEETFIARSSWSISDFSVHKIAQISNIGVYWNPRSEIFSKFSFEEWQHAMQGSIFSDTVGSVSYVASENVNSEDIDSLEKNTVNDNPDSPKNMSPFNIPSPQSPSRSSMQYILAPCNSLKVKIVHSEGTKVAIDGAARLDVVVEITHLNLKLDKCQFLQMTETLYMISELDRQLQLLSQRCIVDAIISQYKYELINLLIIIH